MPKATVGGHPLHPMLVVAPAALLPFGFIMDAMHRATGNEAYANAAYYSLIGGLVGGLAAGAAGAMDYLTVAPHTDVKRTANLHATLNSGALVLTAVNLAARKNRSNHSGGSLVLSAITAIGVMVSSWFGGRMVYEQGMRVKGMSPIEHAPDMKLPGDEMIERTMLKEEKWMPSGGPVLH